MKDTYNTIVADSEGIFKAKGSKFYAFAHPVEDEEEVATFVKTLQDAHHKARHFCYAYRIGLTENRWRANDDGEPNNSAGKPILGQLDSFGLTNVLVVVVRYFGGTKLGMSGLIEAYREAAAEALRAATIEQRILQRTLTIQTGYPQLADLMNAIKSDDWTVVSQEMTTDVRVKLAFRAAEFDDAYRQLWLVLAKAYPGEEQLDSNPPHYSVTLHEA